LRFVADETEEELLRFLESQRPPGTWETTERIMVAVTGAPGNASVVRRAARIASRVKGDLIAVHVASDDVESRRSDIAELEALVSAVGGRWQTLRGDDVAKTIFAAAVDQQITQLVLGTSRLSRWQSMTRGSVVQTLLRLASDNDIDLHVIARRDAGNGRPAADDDG
jgi:two-component system sensor histidine kinase KdpD